MYRYVIAFAVFAACALVSNSLGYAGLVKGTLKNVDHEAMSLDIETSDGLEMIPYNEETVWNAGTDNPDSLVGSQIVVTTSDENDEAVDVDLA